MFKTITTTPMTMTRMMVVVDIPGFMSMVNQEMEHPVHLEAEGARRAAQLKPPLARPTPERRVASARSGASAERGLPSGTGPRGQPVPLLTRALQPQPPSFTSCSVRRCADPACGGARDRGGRLGGHVRRRCPARVAGTTPGRRDGCAELVAAHAG